MFNIEEIRYLCKLNHSNFYLSPKSAYEFLIYGDIDHYEILIEESINDWLKGQQPLDYEYCPEGICVCYRDELIEIKVCSLQGQSIEEYLSKYIYNIDAVSIKVSSKIHPKAFACLKEEYSAIWVDPYGVKEQIKAGLIDILDKEHMTGNQLFKMVYLMMKQNLDIPKDFIEKYKGYTYEVTNDVSDLLFRIIESHHSYYYLNLLDQLGLMEKAYPFVKEIKESNLWLTGMEDLKKLESIFSHYEIFNDAVRRMIERDLAECVGSRISKYQMLKFSILFKNAHRVMKLKLNAPERYEDNFQSFCDYFHFDEEVCFYYSAIIQASRMMIINLEDRIDKHKQYEFYEEYGSLTIDVLLLYFIQSDITESIINHLEYLIKNYVSKYVELQSINSEITTMDINRHELSDIKLTLMLEDIKKRIFFGNLRYDRNHIINYLQKLIEQS